MQTLTVLRDNLRRLVADGPAILGDSFFNGNSQRTLDALRNTRRFTYLVRKIRNTNVRPNVTTTGHLRVRNTIFRVRLIRVNGLRLTAKKQPSLLNRLNSTFIMRMRTNRHVITNQILQLLGSKSNLLILVRFSRTMSLEVISMMTRRYNAVFRHNNLTRYPTRAITMRSIITRRRHTQLAVSRLLTRSRYLNRTVQKELRLMERTRTVLKTISRRALRIQRVLQHKSSRGIASTHRRRRTRQMMSRQLIVCKGRLLQNRHNREMRSHTQASDRGGTFRRGPTFRGILLVVHLRACST